ncbi:MAG TPA: 1-deoxy-D-xylulose-5-phosphate synthase [Gordonia sp. (in: high G+C Gram-positive bacteria)]|uniref:1-deoxy-D-xylulose-5-phosphate synthase n=1 Tax=unclassified Gordonia (in: high G+C Gram-positive bacteria) TaxID=2657482 RepID=UPI000FA5104A|nr:MULTISPECIES: 1-deoxy-D-xylulose-5-phosphate synthase [unclassified Gordonia (in: high G+C Gram-positive bacteria)]RUP41350.1 MAG: 1-deoxy-D-xylulose-5-phosphate synthase [Gordonia sp. (in: high G+C Gram-positive bacteria)]HNP58133.1 1-deoxy-D-xylulose-5-phosphate synthase [Gordonia sp. (in: high G+C Gram-positive bacteria)]HRC50468.1 1-deoxy-D-xylulose-5-phosphate synthase [Gordonia sp. (in: high G+C Gram-positive bacteria)]
MSLLDSIHSPEDLTGLTRDEMDQLADEIRQFLVAKVSATGGHLGPNLGVVELTLAIHRVFDSPSDPVIFDTGHQCYVHKIITGRADGFDELRQRDGLTGYQERAESPHDWVESSHASAALSYADGLSKAFELRGEHRTVVAVVGDGALTGGMCWEALNNIAAARRPVVIVINDNGRSYAPTIGGLAQHLAGLRLQPGYERILEEGRKLIKQMPVVGEPAYAVMHGMKSGIKDLLAPQALFADLGLKYVGPVDGHDTAALEAALRHAKAFGGPVIVHAVTRKGNGYGPAEDHEEDQMHGIGVIDPATGRPASVTAPDWTSVFSAALVEAGTRRTDVVAITAAMAAPTGLAAFGERFPDRLYDVGIAEQHALTSAAGLALGGMHPVVAIYSTFLNRAFDQLLMDVALLRQPVTLVLDRSGITGPDGPSHHGMWDLSLMAMVPGLRVAAPRDAVRLREELDEALGTDDGPTAIRFAKGAVPEDIRAVERTTDGVDILGRTNSGSARPVGDVLVVGIGAFAALACDTASVLEKHGIEVTVVDPRWVLPVPESIVAMAADHRLVVTLEDGLVDGGVGAELIDALAAAGIGTPVMQRGIPKEFIAAATRGEILADLGLSAQELSRTITETVSQRIDDSSDSSVERATADDAG